MSVHVLCVCLCVSVCLHLVVMKKRLVRSGEPQSSVTWGLVFLVWSLLVNRSVVRTYNNHDPKRMECKWMGTQGIISWCYSNYFQSVQRCRFCKSPSFILHVE